MLFKRYVVPVTVFLLLCLVLGLLTKGEESKNTTGEGGKKTESNSTQSVSTEGYTTTASGLKYKDEVVGTGPSPKDGQTVSVHYTGTFTDGKKFDSSLDRGKPFKFPLGMRKVIAGWDEGVATMKVGGKRKLVVPPSLGYGPDDYGPIPGKSTLLFDVELLGVE